MNAITQNTNPTASKTLPFYQKNSLNFAEQVALKGGKRTSIIKKMTIQSEKIGNSNILDKLADEVIFKRFYSRSSLSNFTTGITKLDQRINTNISKDEFDGPKVLASYIYDDAEPIKN